ncbi:DUF5069 domain-containing protein [bacterium]|nr:DUF5069 domain-containing protein [bacterium]
MDEKIIHGPTGESCLDLPSPYQAHSCGLLHLPRFLAKIRKHLQGSLPKSYQRNFTKGFDGFLCLHLGLEPQQIIDCVKCTDGEEELDACLMTIFPANLKAHVWNRKVVQMGTADMAKEKLIEVRKNLDASSRDDLISFADIIDFDERKIP